HENVSAGTVRTAVQNILTDPLERQAMARCGRKLIDGRGPDRLVNAMEILLAGGGRREAVRVAAEMELELTFTPPVSRRGFLFWQAHGAAIVTRGPNGVLQ